MAEGDAVPRLFRLTASAINQHVRRAFQAAAGAPPGPGIYVSEEAEKTVDAQLTGPGVAPHLVKGVADAAESMRDDVLDR